MWKKAFASLLSHLFKQGISEDFFFIKLIDKKATKNHRFFEPKKVS